MYYLFVWDKELAVFKGDGALYEVLIPIELAKYFFALDGSEFPILSSLSFFLTMLYFLIKNWVVCRKSSIRLDSIIINIQII